MHVGLQVCIIYAECVINIYIANMVASNSLLQLDYVVVIAQGRGR